MNNLLNRAYIAKTGLTWSQKLEIKNALAAGAPLQTLLGLERSVCF